MIQIRKCFGHRSYRLSTRIVAYIQFWLNCLYSFWIISKYIDSWNMSFNQDKTFLTTYEKRIYEHRELNYDLGQFSELTSYFLVMYSSCLLKKATFVHNLHFIKFWMVIHCFNLVSSFVCYTVASMRIGGSTLFTAGSLIFVLNSCMLRMVFKFYTEEVALATITSNHNEPSQNNIIKIYRSPLSMLLAIFAVSSFVRRILYYPVEKSPKCLNGHPATVAADTIDFSQSVDFVSFRENYTQG